MFRFSLFPVLVSTVAVSHFSVSLFSVVASLSWFSVVYFSFVEVRDMHPRPLKKGKHKAKLMLSFSSYFQMINRPVKWSVRFLIDYLIDHAFMHSDCHALNQSVYNYAAIVI